MGIYMRYSKKILLTLLLALTLATSPITPMIQNATTVQAATIKMSKKTLTLKVGDKKTLTVSGSTGNITWSSSKKSVAKVSSKGKVTAKSAGVTKITATVDGIVCTCKVTVADGVSSATKKK
ncbi:MAG: Ig-like domain-containing protein [Mobilitalea sp.]